MLGVSKEQVHGEDTEHHHIVVTGARQDEVLVAAQTRERASTLRSVFHRTRYPQTRFRPPGGGLLVQTQPPTWSASP